MISSMISISKHRATGFVPLVMILVLAAGSVASLGACGGARGAASVEYSVSAQRNYEKGMDALQREDWIAAAKYFAFIKSRFPYSKFAVLSELRLADAELGAEEFASAIDNYRLFIRLHPTHEMVSNGYASFRIGDAYYKQLSGDSWLMPPSFEGDQSANEDAAAELSVFAEKYPQSPYREKAQIIIKKVGKKLADHEWYVAQYYWKRDKPMGTVLRLRRLLERYRGVGYDEEALWLLGRAYVAVDMTDRARSTWQELTDKFPKSQRAIEARAAVNALPRTGSPGAAPAPMPSAPAAKPAGPATPAPGEPEFEGGEQPPSPQT
jgi:outer membrane protein assembly factor BamD